MLTNARLGFTCTQEKHDAQPPSSLRPSGARAVAQAAQRGGLMTPLKKPDHHWKSVEVCRVREKLTACVCYTGIFGFIIIGGVPCDYFGDRFCVIMTG